jgi:F-type H+-transporting ATPase subunit b
MIEAAQAQIEQEMQRAQEQMRKEVSALALKAAGQILPEV